MNTLQQLAFNYGQAWCIWHTAPLTSRREADAQRTAFETAEAALRHAGGFVDSHNLRADLIADYERGYAETKVRI